MTAQISETLIYEGQRLAMCTNPLGDYFALGGESPVFADICTALWRGYVGAWEIVEARLYLVGLQGTLEDGSEATLATVFPDYPDRVFAHWYNGTLRIPQGKRLDYVHMGYGSIYERDLFIEIEKGVVTSTRVQHNGESEREDAPEGYGVGAMTVFPVTPKDQDEEKIS
jgi:hypothetical protein